MKPTQSIAAVIYDLDGLMIDSEEISYQIIQGYAAKFSITFTREDYSHLVGRDTQSSGEYLRNEIGTRLPPDGSAAREVPCAREFPPPRAPIRPGGWNALHRRPLPRLEQHKFRRRIRPLRQPYTSRCESGSIDGKHS